MIKTNVWLTAHARESLKKELHDLIKERDTNYSEETSEDVNREFLSRRDREQRIRKIQGSLLNAVVNIEPADDGVVEPGMLVDVRYVDDSEGETLLLAEREGCFSSGVETCSPNSPLGRALLGAREGEYRQYRLPNGTQTTVRVVRVIPYREDHASRAGSANEQHCDEPRGN